MKYTEASEPAPPRSRQHLPGDAAVSPGLGEQRREAGASGAGHGCPSPGEQRGEQLRCGWEVPGELVTSPAPVRRSPHTLIESLLIIYLRESAVVLKCGFFLAKTAQEAGFSSGSTALGRGRADRHGQAPRSGRCLFAWKPSGFLKGANWVHQRGRDGWGRQRAGKCSLPHRRSPPGLAPMVQTVFGHQLCCREVSFSQQLCVAALLRVAL